MRLNILFYSIFFSTSLFSQPENWPPASWKDTAVYKVWVKSGYHYYRTFYASAMLKNGDTLSGYMKISGVRCYILEKGKTVPVVKELNKIKYVQGEIYSLGHNNVRLVNINDRDTHFWRLIKCSSDAAIYDSQEVTGLDNYGPAMILNAHGIRTKIYSDLESFLKRREIDRLLLSFINKKFKESLLQTDFNGVDGMFDYILKKQNNH